MPIDAEPAAGPIETPVSGADATVANCAAWDASAPLHRDNASWRRHAEGFASSPAYSCFDPPMAVALREVGLAGKAVAQLCCNNGRETVSLVNLGAVRAVGFDQSPAFLAQARELAALAGRDCEFVETDVTAIDPRYDRSFDLVVITIGVFGWMPDLGRFMDNAVKILRTGGRLLVHEEHPVANMFEPSSEAPLLVRHSYFRDTPVVGDRAIVYDGAPAPRVGRHYWFVHPLSRVMTAMIARGLVIERFEEYAENISTTEFNAFRTGASCRSAICSARGGLRRPGRAFATHRLAVPPVERGAARVSASSASARNPAGASAFGEPRRSRQRSARPVMAAQQATLIPKSSAVITSRSTTHA